MKHQKLLVDETLRPGDVLYVPRGFIHEGVVPKDTTSVHLTIGPQFRTWSEFFVDMPLPMLAQMPAPPGKAPWEPTANFKPGADFELLVTRGGTPQSLRKYLPRRISQHCGDVKFKKMALQKLRALDPQLSTKQIERRLSEFDAQLAQMGHEANVVADICRSFVAVMLRSFVSEDLEAAEAADADLDGPLCVQSPVAARVVPDWMTPPGYQKGDDEALLILSSMNGPTRRAGVAPTEDEVGTPTMPMTIPAGLGRILAGALHKELNPDSLVRPEALLAQARSGDDRKKLRSILRRLVEYRALKPLRHPDTRAEL